MRVRPLLAALLLAASAPLPAAAQDVLTAGSTSAGAGGTAAVPLYLQDVNGTPLGVNAGIGKRIQAIAFRVTFTPPSAVTAASFMRAGVLGGLTPLYERTVHGTGSIAWIGSFSETSRPIPLTANAATPGNRIGTLTLTLAGGLVNGSTVTLAFDPVTTLLSNQTGMLTESPFSHALQLTGGSITIGGATTTTTLNTTPNPCSTTAGSHPTASTSTWFVPSAHQDRRPTARSISPRP